MHEAAIEPNRTDETTRRRIQFSIKTLLVTTTMVAVLLGAITVPEVAAIVAAIAAVVLYSGFVTFCVIAAIWGRGWIRPFAIAAGIYSIVAILVLLGAGGRPMAMLVLSFFNLAISGCVGLSAASAHGFLAKRNGIIPIPNVPILRNWLHNPS